VTAQTTVERRNCLFTVLVLVLVLEMLMVFYQ
jgi:hypothetical protein